MNTFARALPLLAGSMSFLLMPLHHRSRSHFLRSLSIAAGSLCAVLDMLVLALLLLAYTTQALSFGHFLSNSRQSVDQTATALRRLSLIWTPLLKLVLSIFGEQSIKFPTSFPDPPYGALLPPSSVSASIDLFLARKCGN
jgi:hypothetical protein